MRYHPAPQRLHHKKFKTFTIKRTSLFSYGGSGCSRSKVRLFGKRIRLLEPTDEIDTSKPKFYVLEMFPYPSGAGQLGYM
ncbi:hypothetical protein Q3G72_026321 [Acer saccharum]|nr:hypothetical protein Q3G72_026321 [Acer saccharum]